MITINGNTPPNGALLGAFYENDNGEYSCGGYLPWTGEQLAVAVWASESGLDNGFSAGEEITWLLLVGNQTFITDNVDMNSNPPFSETFTANGFGQLLSANYECEISGIWGCTDDTAYNYNSEATIDDGSCYNLSWEVTPTDCNMTVLINEPEILNGSISLNGGEIPNGSNVKVKLESFDTNHLYGTYKGFKLIAVMYLDEVPKLFV